MVSIVFFNLNVSLVIDRRISEGNVLIKIFPIASSADDRIKILNDFSERLIHMHCKDIRKRVLEKSLKEDLSFRGAVVEGAFTVPGDGCIDYKPLFDVLKEKNYSGWLVVEAEQDPSKANPFEYAKIGYKYLTGTLNKSNLEVFQN